MKQFLWLAATTVLLVAQSAPVKTVYLLPMPGGLEQYLALHLTKGTVLQVVTDPQKADAVMTDHIGEDFEQSLNELYKPAQPVSNDVSDFARPTMRPLSRNRGTVFLVDRNNHNILWSTFEQPSSTDPKDLNRTAEKIVERLTDSWSKQR